MIEVLVISISNPMLIGVYENKKLINSYEVDGKTSDVLPIVFEEILNKYEISGLFYVNSPGSYMAIKVAYVFLKSIAITKNIELKATFGFNFNNNSPIKALGKKYFTNNNGEIKIDFLDNNVIIEEFVLPEILNHNIFNNDSLPQYNLPAV